MVATQAMLAASRNGSKPIQTLPGSSFPCLHICRSSLPCRSVLMLRSKGSPRQRVTMSIWDSAFRGEGPLGFFLTGCPLEATRGKNRGCSYPAASRAARHAVPHGIFGQLA